MSKKPLLVCVVGPTGIGKTSLAIKIANYFSTEILSADSRQFYKEMAIGTAVPSTEELAAARHHFIQHISIKDSYSVGDFEKEALQLLDKLFLDNKVVVMVGGSGLYVDAVVKGLDTFPEVPKSIRDLLNNKLETEGIEALQEELKNVDPITYNSIETSNPRRLIRALEVYKASGKPYASFKKAKPQNRPFNTLYIGLTADRSIVYNRINKRVDIMMEAGLLAEVQQLEKYKHLNALQTVGYRELFAHLSNKCTLQEAVEEIKKNTRRFAKRQGTWFRKNSNIHWVAYDAALDASIPIIKKAL